jgi:hypothetical protein
MAWVFRIILGMAIAAYAGWLAWPLIQPLTAGGSPSEVISAVTTEADLLGGVLPSLWLGSALLYLVAAVLTAGGLGAAPGAYFLGFGAEVIQRLLLQSAPDPALVDTPARIAAVLAPLNLAVDSGPLALGALLAVGLLVLMTGTWRGHKGQALTRHWTEPPIYA